MNYEGAVRLPFFQFFPKMHHCLFISFIVTFINSVIDKSIQLEFLQPLSTYFLLWIQFEDTITRINDQRIIIKKICSVGVYQKQPVQRKIIKFMIIRVNDHRSEKLRQKQNTSFKNLEGSKRSSSCNNLYNNIFVVDDSQENKKRKKLNVHTPFSSRRRSDGGKNYWNALLLRSKSLETTAFIVHKMRIMCSNEYNLFIKTHQKIE